MVRFHAIRNNIVKENAYADSSKIKTESFLETKIDKDGNITHFYEKIEPKEEPKKEEPKQIPKKQEPNVQTKEQPSKVVEYKQLPNTGSTNTVYTGLGALILGMFAGIRKRKNEE